MTENFEKNNKRNQAPDLRPKNHKEYNTKKKKKNLIQAQLRKTNENQR